MIAIKANTAVAHSNKNFIVKNMVIFLRNKELQKNLVIFNRVFLNFMRFEAFFATPLNSGITYDDLAKNFDKYI
jgi:hypothetical protein